MATLNAADRLALFLNKERIAGSLGPSRNTLDENGADAAEAGNQFWSTVNDTANDNGGVEQVA